MGEKQFKYYLPAVALTTIMLLGTVIGFNTIIDPYAMNDLITIPGINVYTPCTETRLRLLKAHEVERAKPDSIILGSSRCHFGFRTGHPGWMKESQKRYNLAMDGATTKEMYYYLVHANSVHPLKMVLLGLDTYHPFRPVTTAPDFDTNILMDNAGFLSEIKIFFADIKILVSLDTLKNSIMTIRKQKSVHVSWDKADGQRSGEEFFHRADGDFKKFGQRYLFDEIDKSDVQYFVDIKEQAPKESRIYAEAPIKKETLTSMDYIGKIIEFCRGHGIKLIIFFTPEHARHLELAAAGIGLEKIENGKRGVVQLLAEDARQHPGEAPFALFDFSGYSQITTEPLPPVGSHKEMKYYWESSHFKENAGDLVLNRIFGIEDPQNPVPSDFGILLTQENIESVIVQLERGHMEYGLHHPEEIKQIKKWVDDFKKEHNSQ